MKPNPKTSGNRNFLSIPELWRTTAAAIKRRGWLLGYELEDTRQLYSSGGCLWKEAVTCVVLALLRLGRLV